MVEERMSEELEFRSKVVELLRPLLAFPIENTAAVGTPDVACVFGFIELKIASRPMKSSSRVEVDVRNSQRIWMKNWIRHGGRAWFLTRIDELWMVHDGEVGASSLGREPESDLKLMSDWFSGKTPTSTELSQVFSDLSSR